MIKFCGDVMPKTKFFRVTSSRFQFRCAECNAKQWVTVAPGVRKRSFRCQSCKEITRCVLNRRVTNREQQLGKVLVTTSDGSTIDANLFDMSLYGVGFEAKYNDIRKLSVGKVVTFQCPWNPRLLSGRKYLIRSIHGQRVGVEVQHRT